MNIQAMMREAQKLQKEMTKEKDEIDATIYEGESSFVKVKVNGKKEVVSIEITEKIDDMEMLQDVILVAINDAMKKVDADTEKRMAKYTKGLPGLF